MSKSGISQNLTKKWCENGKSLANFTLLGHGTEESRDFIIFARNYFVWMVVVVLRRSWDPNISRKGKEDFFKELRIKYAMFVKIVFQERKSKGSDRQWISL